MSTLKNVADWLTNVRGRRKAMLFLSEGIDYDMYNIFEARHASSVLDDVREAIAAATRANVNIYSIDPRGLSFLGSEMMDFTNLPDDTSEGLGTGALLKETQVAQDSLRVLADETGGFAAVNANDFKPAFDRIVQENSSYYVLGYQPSNDRRDGRYRKIQVRVKRPGLQVRARRGYVAPRGRPQETKVAGSAGTSPALMELLNSPLPMAGLTLETTAAAFRGKTGGSVLVTTQVDGRRFAFVETGGMFATNLELSLIAVDRTGKVVAMDRNAIELKLKPDTYRMVAANGFRLLSRFEVPTGRYQLRVAARESNAGVSGSVHTDLEVPDFAADPLTMSGIVVTSTSAGRVPTARPDALLKDVLAAPPVSDRAFTPKDTIIGYVEIYDNRTSASDVIDVTATLTDASNRVVVRAVEERRAPDGTPGARTYAQPIEMSLGDAEPGQYRLRVEARARSDRDRIVAREIPIQIVAP
jgi:hypothetical protein